MIIKLEQRAEPWMAKASTLLLPDVLFGDGLITNNPNKEHACFRQGAAKTRMDLSSSHVLNPVVHDASSAGSVPEECNARKNVLLTTDPDEVHLTEKPEDRTTFSTTSTIAHNPEVCSGEKSHECQKTSHFSAFSRHQKTEMKEKIHSSKGSRDTLFQKRRLVQYQRVAKGKKTSRCEVSKKVDLSDSNLTVEQGIPTTDKSSDCRKGHHRTHLGEKPYGYKECKKTFSQKLALTVHHTGEQPYERKECRKITSWKSQLILPPRYCVKEKPYACEECGNAFCLNSQLTVHQKIHTGKLCEGEECGKRFSQKSQFTVHQSSHWKETL